MLSLLLLSASASDPFLETRRNDIIDTCYQMNPPRAKNCIVNPDAPLNFKACINKGITIAKGFSTDGWSDIVYPNGGRIPTDTASFKTLEWCYDQPDFKCMDDPNFKGCRDSILSARAVAEHAFSLAYFEGGPITPGNILQKTGKIKEFLQAQFRMAALRVEGLPLARMIGCAGVGLAGKHPRDHSIHDKKKADFIKCSGF